VVLYEMATGGLPFTPLILRPDGPGQNRYISTQQEDVVTGGNGFFLLHKIKLFFESAH